jgi:hypothetical protein
VDQHGTSAIKSALTVPNRDWLGCTIVGLCLDDALDTAETQNDRRRQALSHVS